MILPDSFARQAAQLFQRMDQAYARAAASSGFACHGCQDNCCLTRFFHHTLVELLYLKSGLAALPSGQQKRLQQKAREVLQQTADLEGQNQPVRVMCPLNEAQRCSLYAHRPMICRLHGIPHQLHRPDGRMLTGPGCQEFYVQCRLDDGAVLDRTPWYVEMAQLEKTLRSDMGFDGKIKMTIAEMVITE